VEERIELSLDWTRRAKSSVVTLREYSNLYFNVLSFPRASMFPETCESCKRYSKRVRKVSRNQDESSPLSRELAFPNYANVSRQGREVSEDRIRENPRESERISRARR